MRRPHSYSSISLYQKCPHLFEWRYVLGKTEPPGAAADRGTRLHLLLEKFFLGETPYPVADKTLAPWRRYMERLALYNPKPEEEVAVDRDWNKVEFDDPNAFIRGKLDLRYDLDGVRHIVDWKSGKVYDSHEAQGKMYMALDSDTGKYRTEFVYLDMPTHTVPRDYTHVDRSIEIEKLIAVVDVINADTEYKPTPSYEGCKWCPRSWRRGGDCRRAP